MEQKQEKVCKVLDLKLGHRYSLTRTYLRHEYILTVTAVDEKYVTFIYGDGKIGAAELKDTFSEFYEFPFSSLEKELL